MSIQDKDNRRTGRPSSGHYGTTEDISAYRREYNSRIDPEKALQYRLKQAYNLLREYGEQYGYEVKLRENAPCRANKEPPRASKETQEHKQAGTALERLLDRIVKE